MLIARIIPAVFFSLLLLFSQQSGMLHVLHHVYTEKTQQQDKQTPHTIACEQCTNYAQFGNTVASSDHSFHLLTPATQDNPQPNNFYLSRYTPVATARGPPAFPKTA
jgi:hypothetical protein